MNVIELGSDNSAMGKRSHVLSLYCKQGKNFYTQSGIPPKSYQSLELGSVYFGLLSFCCRPTSFVRRDASTETSLTVHSECKAMPRLKDVMTRVVITAREGDSLLDAQRLMVRNNIKRLIIVDDQNSPIGITTQKDMVRELVKGNTKPLDKIPIKSVMTGDPICLEDKEDLKKVAQLMIVSNISSIIAVDKLGKISGIITKSDICRYLSTLADTGIAVKRYMSKSPVTISQYHSIFVAAHVLSDRKFTRLIVTEKNKPVGMITLSDLVSVGAVLSTPRGTSLSLIVKGELLPSRMLPILLVKNIMTPDPITINESADISDAARLMIKHSISGLPVVNEKAILTGIITKTDLVKASTKMK